MGLNPFTLKYKIKAPNKAGECIVFLRYYSKGVDFLIPTSVRVRPDQFLANKPRSPISRSHPAYATLNAILESTRISLEAKIHEAKGDITKDYLIGKTSSKNTIFDFIEDLKQLRAGKMSVGTLRHYTVIQGKIEDFSPRASFASVSFDWLQRLEKYIRDRVGSNNTVSTNMGKVIAILNAARKAGLIDAAQFEEYSRPAYKEDIPVYLQEHEIEAFYNVVKAVAPGQTKRSGYYFLLSCYTGYRISDLSSFVYDDRVKGDTIVLRAKKNGVIVSIPIYPRLGEILSFCKDNRLDVYEQDMREQVKDLAKLAGIKAQVKVHSARHSFAMLMLEKGLTIDEIAELLGDSKDIARRYARISNKQFHRRVLEVMK